MSHLRIGVSARTTTALLDVESTTTASSANRVGLVMSLTKWRSTFRLSSSLVPLCTNTLLLVHLFCYFILPCILLSVIHLPFAFKEYSNTLSTPERETFSGYSSSSKQSSLHKPILFHYTPIYFTTYIRHNGPFTVSIIYNSFDSFHSIVHHFYYYFPSSHSAFDSPFSLFNKCISLENQFNCGFIQRITLIFHFTPVQTAESTPFHSLPICLNRLWYPFILIVGSFAFLFSIKCAFHFSIQITHSCFVGNVCSSNSSWMP